MSEEGIRESRGELKFLRSELHERNGRRRRMAVLLCSCGKQMITALAKWQNTPINSCRACSLKNIRSRGFGRLGGMI